MSQVDDKFYDKADEHIHLSNKQLANIGKGKVSASMMYSVARFNSWVSASGFRDGMEMSEAMEETIDYFVSEYKKMLVDNLEDCTENFDKYMKTS